MKKNIHMIALACGLSLLPVSAAIHAQEGAPQQPAAKVTVITLEKRLMAATSDTAASVISLNNSELASEVEGQLRWIAEVGTTVKKGDLIARLDRSLFDIGVRRAQADVKRLEAEVTFQKGEVARQKELSQNDFASRSRLQMTVNNHDKAQADLMAARASYDMAVRALNRSEIRAPFDGVVVERMAGVGSYLNAGSMVARFVDTAALEIHLSMPVRYLPFMKGVKTVLVKDDFGQTANAKVRTLVPVSDFNSRQVTVRLVKDGDQWPDNWIAGSALTAVIPASPKQETLALPREALIIRGSSIMVYKVAGTSAIPVPVQVDYASGNWVAIRAEGLAAGDQIITRGGERLQPGQPVEIME